MYQDKQKSTLAASILTVVNIKGPRDSHADNLPIPKLSLWRYWGKILLGSLFFFLVSCKGNNTAEKQHKPFDTAGLAAFKSQKLSDSMADLNASNRKGGSYPQEEAVDGINTGMSGMGDPGAPYDVNTSHGDDTAMYGAGASTGMGTEQGTIKDEGGHPGEVPRKKKISGAAKGAIIGAGSGAILGAIITKKNKGLGAVIGAAIGGGAGYGIGKHKDNKKAE